MQEEHQTRITSAEIAALWSSYQNNSMASCVLKYFIENADDQEVEAILDYALDISHRSIRTVKEILSKNNQPIPVGFSEGDVNTQAPRLYSDAFYLLYIKNMSKVGVSVYGVALATAAQAEVRKYLSQAIQSSTELYNKTAEALLAKGLFVRPPFITTPDQVDFVDKQSYLGGFLKLNRRPLNVLEITHLKANIETNIIGQSLLAGFAQVASSQKVREYCYRGKETAKKHVRIFSAILSEDDLPAPMEWDLQVSDSTTPALSDRLIMFHTSLLIASSISNYATAAAASFRMDIAASYTRLAAENAQYAKDGTSVMINHGWLEQPPQNVDRKELAKV